MINSCVVLSDNDSTYQYLQKALSRLNHFKIDGYASNEEEAFGLLFENVPQVIFYEVSKAFPWTLLSDLHRYFKDIPSVIVIAPISEMAMALDFGAVGFISNIIDPIQIQKTLMRWHRNKEILQLSKNISENQINSTSISSEHLNQFQLHLQDLQLNFLQFQQKIDQFFQKPNNQFPIEKFSKEWLGKLEELQQNITTNLLLGINNSKAYEDNPAIICVKSYGDYKFVELNQILFLKADNNSTDITMKSGEVITAFKTLKYFMEMLPDYFHRIHNSYIVNMYQIGRIHLGNSVIFMKESKLQIPFSKSYKEKVEALIQLIVGETDTIQTSEDSDSFLED